VSLVARTPSQLKGWIYGVLQSEACGSIKIRSIKARGALPILNLHRIASRDSASYAPLDPDIFENLLVWLKRNFTLLRFAELSTIAPSAKPPIVLSFDDGYKDFIEYAVPILEKHAVRVNHNIVPAVVESGRPPMNVTIQDFIASAPASLLREVPLPGLPEGADPDNREKCCLLASASFKNKPIAEQKAIFARLDAQFSRFDGFRETPVMTLQELKQISGVHELGAHSFEHASMAAETDAYLREDVQKCRSYFVDKLGFAPNIYAFPNGSVRPGQAEHVHDEGFDHVLLVGENYSRRAAWLHHRFTIHGQTPEEARARALGWFKRTTRTDAG